jgi:hypothetical protein
MLGGSGCLGYRLTPEEVVQLAQGALAQSSVCRSVLEFEIDTDLLKDSATILLWEERPALLKVTVLKAENLQLEGLAFATDGKESVSFSPHDNRVLVGPADQVKLPQVIETALRSRIAWLQDAEAQEARLVARERQDGLVVYKIEVPLAYGGAAEYAIDARQWWVRQVEYQDEILGQGRISVREIECYDRAPDGTFDLAFPEGVPVQQVELEETEPLTLKEAQLAAPFPLRAPAYLPEGTQFGMAYRLDKNIALVYTGQHSFTLVQGPGIGQAPQEGAETITLRGHQATLIPDPEHAGMVLTWREDELQFAISGSLEKSEIIQLAESLELAFGEGPDSEAPDAGSETGKAAP